MSEPAALAAPEAKKARVEPAASAAPSGGGQDSIWVPMSNVKRVVKNRLTSASGGGQVTCTADAFESLQRATTVFISYLTACSHEFAREAKRTTITKEEVQKALRELDLGMFEDRLLAYVDAHAGMKAAGGGGSKDGAPKKSKPLSGFFFYSGDTRGKIRAENPALSLGEVAKELGRTWKLLSEDEQKAWSEKSKAAFEEKQAKEAAAAAAAAGTAEGAETAAAEAVGAEAAVAATAEEGAPPAAVAPEAASAAPEEAAPAPEPEAAPVVPAADDMAIE